MQICHHNANLKHEIDEENIALILEVIDKSLMLDCTSVIESVGGFGPGLVSTSAIIRRKAITALKKIFKI